MKAILLCRISSNYYLLASSSYLVLQDVATLPPCVPL